MLPANFDTAAVGEKREERPRDFDVIITPDASAPGRFALRRVKGNPEVSWGSRGAAVELARRFADAFGVDVWIAEGRTVSLLYRHDPNAKPAPVPTLTARVARRPLARRG